MITRRTMLGAVAATSMPLPAVAAPPPVQSPEERLQAAIEELQAAANAALPGIGGWKISRGDSTTCPLLVIAFGDQPTKLTRPR